MNTFLKPEPIPDEARLLTYVQVAAMLQLSERKVWSLVNSGQLPKVGIGRTVRIDRDDVNRFIARRKGEAHGRHHQ